MLMLSTTGRYLPGGLILQSMADIEIIMADITRLRVDGVVNAANNTLLGGGGVDGAIHRAAGPELLEYCRGLNGCVTGEAKITPGFMLPAKFVIHTVGPVWQDGHSGEERLLEQCYHSCLKLATENDLASIAFPCISTGIYRFPFEKAARIALQTIHNYLKNAGRPEKFIMTVFSQIDFEKYKKVYDEFGPGDS
jgi:O-acetyl-ADP-ribose deacetylase (regulator of RNase III)